ncbi:MAG: serine hydrolase [Puniceicoccales bacterium]
MLYEKKIVPPRLLLVFFSLFGATLMAQNYDPERLQEYIDARVGSDLNQSIIVGVTSLSGERFFTAGKVSADNPREPKPDDVFEIGGVTNVFTAAAAASMVVDRQITWLQPVNAYLPDYVAVPSFGHLPLQLVHLVTHTSGLPNIPPNLQPEDEKDPMAGYTFDHLYVLISVYGLKIPPGEVYQYSTMGYGLLGHVLTLRANQTYDELIQTRVARPLALKETTAVLNPDTVVPGHQGLETVPNWHWGNGIVGGGGLYSSARDLLRFVGAQMQMMKLEKDDQRALLSTQNAYKQTSMPSTMVGYGWHITRKDLGAVYWQNGKTGGYAAYVGFNPSRRTGCVILTNSAVPIDELGFYVLDPENFPLPEPPPTGIRPARTLEQYLGVYQVGPDVQLIITRDGGKLYAEISGEPKYRIYPMGKDEFAYATGNVRIFFKTGPREAEAVSVRIGMKQMQGRRVK